jgi:hypothetical protein
MGETVQDGQDGSARIHRRAERLDRRTQVIGFAGQQDHVPAGPDLFSDAEWAAPIARAWALDQQSVTVELRLAARANQEGDVLNRAGLRQPPPEVSADSAGAEDQNPHRHLPERQRS